MQEQVALRADFHTHPLGDRYYPRTVFELSPADKYSIRSFLYAMAQGGLQVLACTDHNTIVSGLWAKETAQREGLPLLVIPGSEVSARGTTQHVHLLAMNIKHDLPAGWPVGEAVREIHRQGGVAVLAHPVKYPQEISLNPDMLLELDGIETNNLSEGIFPARRYLTDTSCYRDKYILQTTGSDLHWGDTNTTRTNGPRPYFRVPVNWLLEKGIMRSKDLSLLI